jgi:hypothetical protein
VFSANFADTASLLKNPFAPSYAPGSGAEYAVFVAFWPCFQALFNRRPSRHLLFQQCTMALAEPPRSHENGSVASAIFTPGCGVLRSTALPWCSGPLCAMSHIHSPHTWVCCLRYVAC